MRFTYLIPMLASAAVLASCAGLEAEPPKAATPAAALAEAELAFQAGRHEQAFSLLQTTTFAFPLEKAPWIRMAQLRFERGQYGEAINNAAHAIELDPDDKLAHTILAVSGLRVSSKALADLTVKHNISGDVRTEAQELAKLMRATLGEDVLVPLGSRTIAKPVVKRPLTSSVSGPAGKTSTSADPFANLR